MAIEEKQLTEEQKQTQAQDLRAKEDAITKDLIKSLDLPANLTEAIDEAEEKTEEESPTKDAEEIKDEVSEEVSEESSEETSEDDELDLKSKSKVQKRIDELNRQIKQRDAELNRLKSKTETDSPSDPDMAKLEKMEESQLKDLKKKVALATRREQDDAKAAELFELEEKIDRAIANAPKRFQGQQTERFYDAVAATDLDASVKETIFQTAKNIFSKSQSMQKSINGQAEAWQLAVDHYKELSKLSAGKSKTEDLERKLNTLKKKTSLDTAVQKGNSKVSEEAKLYNKAKSGNDSDKVNFFKNKLNTDSLIPDEYRGR